MVIYNTLIKNNCFMNFAHIRSVRHNGPERAIFEERHPESTTIYAFWLAV